MSLSGDVKKVNTRSGCGYSLGILSVSLSNLCGDQDTYSETGEWGGGVSQVSERDSN